MKDYEKNKELSYLKYWNINNFCGWEILRKLPVNGFEWIENIFEFDECFIKNCNEESDEGYFPQVDVQYTEKPHELHNGLPFFFWQKKIEKVEKLIANLHDKTKHVIHIKNLKQALIHGLVLKKVQRVIKFNLEAWLKTHIDMNAKLRKKAENNFEKNFLKLMSNAIFVKAMENMRKYGDIKLVITDRRKNYLVSKSNYTTKFFTETLLAIEMQKTQILRNKPVYLGISILEDVKTRFEFYWFHCLKEKIKK